MSVNSAPVETISLKDAVVHPSDTRVVTNVGSTPASPRMDYRDVSMVPITPVRTKTEGQKIEAL